MLRALALLLALAALGVTGVALAAARTINDPRDTPGKLDIGSASLSAKQGQIVATITTHGAWAPADLGTRSRQVCVRIWTKSSPLRSQDYSICAERPSARAGLVGSVYRHGHIESPIVLLGRATVKRADSRTIELGFRSKLIGNPRSLRWQASSFYTAFDLAPDKSPVRQALR